ncbi:MAG: aminotransferase class V-fold PLP-dependent enzyme, partial [Clostridia bacterium]|nr:aminotransferase class V-fold PLP-dependent enzyme [Clostridia bacterium]
MIYFDNAATTKPSLEAIKLAEKFNNEEFYNPSTLYSGGLNCAREIKVAKESIIKNIGAKDCDVIFTSCGTESDNMAIFCSVKRGTYLTDLGEHSAVYKSFLELKQRGNKVDFVGLNIDGKVNEDELYKKVVENNVDFVSIMHVNNETGAINDVNKIAKTIKSINKKIIFHVDGVQAFGKIPYRLSSDIDLYSISAHKINGLKGVGALIRRKNVNVAPLIIGGGQEAGFRSGTENVFGIKVFEYSANVHFRKIKENFEHVKQIKYLISEKLDKSCIEII